MAYDPEFDGPHPSEAHPDIISLVVQRFAENSLKLLDEPLNPVELTLRLHEMCAEHTADMYGTKYASYSDDWDEVLMSIIVLCLDQYQKQIEEYGIQKPISTGGPRGT